MSEHHPFLVDVVPVFPLIHAVRLVCQSTFCNGPLTLLLGHHGMFTCSAQPDPTHGPSTASVRLQSAAQDSPTDHSTQILHCPLKPCVFLSSSSCSSLTPTSSLHPSSLTQLSILSSTNTPPSRRGISPLFSACFSIVYTFYAMRM